MGLYLKVNQTFEMMLMFLILIWTRVFSILLEIISWMKPKQL
ncbi:UNVERIFIED_CONTAM: hypothetical protein NCL1_59070 [Trichonephila clavipes]